MSKNFKMRLLSECTFSLKMWYQKSITTQFAYLLILSTNIYSMPVKYQPICHQRTKSPNTVPPFKELTTLALLCNNCLYIDHDFHLTYFRVCFYIFTVNTIPTPFILNAMHISPQPRNCYLLIRHLGFSYKFFNDFVIIKPKKKIPQFLFLCVVLFTSKF